MKKIIFLPALFLSLFVIGQNVGIGTNNPSQKLDVNGNINLSGNVRVKNVAGQANQILMTNAIGETVWGNSCDFKYSVCFKFTSPNQTWTVPVGVTKIMVELWGGGGGGAAGGGGGGGSYSQAVVNVTPGAVYNIVVGTGGAGAVNEASDGSQGSSSSIAFPGNTIVAWGGFPAGTTYSGYGNGSLSGNYITIPGNNGIQTVETYAQRSSTEFATIRKYGDGGKSLIFNGNEGKGATFTFNTATGANISLISCSTAYGLGAGGGGGPIGAGYATWGSSGANGMVIIHY